MSTINNDPTQTPSLQARYEYWKACPINQISNLFFKANGATPVRTAKYQIDSSVLSQLVDQVAGNSFNFRVFMSANPDIPYQEQGTLAPSFTPIVQVYNVSHMPGSVNENAVLPVWKDFDAPGFTASIHPIPITENHAEQMILDWMAYAGDRLDQTVEDTQLGRLRWTTFTHNDAEMIRQFIQENMAYKPVLNIYLGYSVPTSDLHPFGFRIILNVSTEEPVNNIDPSPAYTFFEVSNPCPPLCTPSLGGS